MKLFIELETKKPNWWKNIISEKGVYIDIRKDNYIDIYFSGGNIIRELKFDGEKYSGSINYKYLLSEKSEYIKYDFSLPKVELAQKKIDLLAFSDFEHKEFKRIKDNISKYYPASSEKGTQAKFVNKTDCLTGLIIMQRILMLKLIMLQLVHIILVMQNTIAI